MLETTQIDDINALDPVRLAWSALWRKTPQASFFQSLDWLEVYWRHFGAGQQLRVCVVRRSGEVLGVVPLVVRRERTRLGPVRVLTYPLHDWGSFYGPIGPDPAATLTAACRYVRHQPRDWDLLDLRWVNRVEVDRGRTPTALDIAGFPHDSRVWRTTACIDFSGTWEQYLASRGGKFRSNLRRAELAAARAGELTFHRYRPAGACHGEDDCRWDLFDDCLELSQRSWQGSSNTGTTISHPGVRAFFRDLFGVAAGLGALDLNLLRLNGRLVAFTFNLHMHGSITGLRLGYDPRWSALSPGRLLMARSIEDSLRRGDRRLDLGSESLSFKRPWLTRLVDGYHYTHYPLCSWRSQLLRLKQVLRPRPASAVEQRDPPAPHLTASP